MAPRAPKVSVIMPVYNVDRFVARAIESVQNQTLEDWELLVVDDGSTDRSGDVADRLATRDIRIDVIHTQNQGAAAARNVALDRARGTYVHFIDGDDWLERDCLADMVALAEGHSLELAIAGFFIETFYGDADQHTLETKSRPSQVYATQAEFRSGAWSLFDENLLYTPWNKLFLRSRIEDLHLRFRPTFMDDFPFVLDYIRDVERVAVTDHAYYHFIRSRAESETSKWRPDIYEKREEEHSWMLDLYEHWGLAGDPASMEMVQRRYIERLVGCIENLCEPACTLSTAEKRGLIRKMISSDRAKLAVSVARPRSRMMAAMLVPIRRQDVTTTYNEGCLISFVKRHNTKVFATLRANR
ncbi:MAG: glycosyltransferase [Atopobiaceae bacterium]|jgi:glycosyltransferase EpsJ|nr:glycosyltransferase [Atopobiaceae bacterium]MCI2173960.1 glycosyltransferase [Atopobiaceae bacterium]MCI2207950.1 glycosyltransferase [Atopobiaceae bacterium]